MATIYPTIEVARTEDNVRIAGTGITAFLQWEIGGKAGDEYYYTTTGELVIGEKQYQLYLHWSCEGNDISIMDGDDIVGTFKYKGNEVHVNMIVTPDPTTADIMAAHDDRINERLNNALEEIGDLKNQVELYQKQLDNMMNLAHRIASEYIADEEKLKNTRGMINLIAGISGGSNA